MYKKRGVTTSFVIICAYLLSTLLGFLYKFLYPREIYDYNFFSMIYYIACLVIFFIPLIKNNYNCNTFTFPETSTRVLSIIVMIGGFVILYSDFTNFDIGRLQMSWLEQRNEYYANYHDEVIATTWFDRISSNFRHLSFLSIPLSFFYLSKGDNKLALLLGFSSFSILSRSVMNASRQEFVLWIVTLLYSFYFFKYSLSKENVRLIKLILGIAFYFILSLVVAITFSRFGSETGGDTLNSFFFYAGAQPYNAARFLENLSSQAQWGMINFPYVTGTEYIKSINEYIRAPFYLNVFGSLVGSFYLDFGYFTILFVFIYSFLFDKLLSFYKRRKSLAYFYIYFLYCDILFSGLFYYRYVTSERIRIIFLGFILIVILDYYKINKFKKYDRRFCYNSNL